MFNILPLAHINNHSLSWPMDLVDKNNQNDGMKQFISKTHRFIFIFIDLY